MKRSTVLRAGMIGLGWICFNSVPVSSSTSAQPLYVSVSDAQYTTYVEAQGSPVETYPAISRTSTASYPIGDEIDQPMTDVWPGMVLTNYAVATAGLFTVSDRTGWGFARAEAVSQLWFFPVTDQSVTLDIQIFAEGHSAPVAFTAGQITLRDSTMNSELWNYSWNQNGSAGPFQVPPGTNIPWEPGLPTIDLSVPTDFLASHEYELIMAVSSDAGDDTEIVEMDLSGLQAVPEPPSAVLFAMTGLGLALVSKYKSWIVG